MTQSDPNNPNDYFPYSYITVPAGQTVNYQGDFILSGPASGTIEQLIKMVQ